MEMDPSFVCTETGLLLELEPCLKPEAERSERKNESLMTEKQREKNAGENLSPLFKDFVCIPHL